MIKCNYHKKRGYKMSEKNMQNSPKIKASESNLGGGCLDKNKYPRSKKTTLKILGILLLICVVIGVSYAYWTTSSSQEGINALDTDC
jgi:hypothetical protein